MAIDETQNVNDLIVAICQDVDGIGPTTANAVAADFMGNFSEFLDADAVRLEAIANSKKKRYLNDAQIHGVLDGKKPYIGKILIREAWIFHIGRQFLKTVVRNLKSLKLSDIDINPFLAIALELKTSGQVLKFNLYQSVTRSIVTSWGSVVETLLARCGGEKFISKNSGRSGRRPDITKIIAGKQYFLQVKSGPNTMNVDMVNSLNEVIDEYSKSDPDAKMLLGMTYGTKKMISSQIRTNLQNFDESVLIGRELWSFISEQKDYHKRIFEILDTSSAGILTMPFTDMMAEKLEELVLEWKLHYVGMDLQQVLDHYM